MEDQKLATPPARIVLETGRKRVPLDRKILGQFVEHLGRCIENGIWMYEATGIPLLGEAPLERVPSLLIDSLQHLRMPILRWPGGCFADTYHWKDGIGPRETRPVRKNKAWGGIKNYKYKLGPEERNHFGTDEFLAFCERLDCDALINVNYGSGTPDEAASWVAYARSKSTRANIWGIANEIWGFYEAGFEKTPESYAKRYLEFARAMKAANPAIKLMAVGWIGHPSWNRTLLRLIKGHVDYLSIHLYFGNKPSLPFLFSTKPLPSTEAFYNVELNSAVAFEKLIEQANEDLDAVYGKDDLARCKIAFDEWNVWSTMAQIYRADGPHYRFVEGVWSALVINTFIRQAESVGMANYAQLVNTIGLVLTDHDKIIFTPQYLVMRMYGDALQDLALPCTIVCQDSISSTRYSKDFPAAKSPAVDATATISTDGKRVSIFLVNKHFVGRTGITITRDGEIPMDLEGKPRVTMLTNQDAFTCNTKEAPDRITLQPWPDVAVESGSVRVDMPPHSVAAVQLSIREAWPAR